MTSELTGEVVGLHRSDAHTFTKSSVRSIVLVAGLGVAGDAHAGATVRHRSRVAADPSKPNLRQVHLLPREMLDEAAARGFALAPGELGENITTAGLDLHALPTGTTVALGDGGALLALTGLRNPCVQIDRHRRGLRAVFLDREGRTVQRRAGVMAVVVRGGRVRVGDRLRVAHPPAPWHPLECV